MYGWMGAIEEGAQGTGRILLMPRPQRAHASRGSERARSSHARHSGQLLTSGFVTSCSCDAGLAGGRGLAAPLWGRARDGVGRKGGSVSAA